MQLQKVGNSGNILRYGRPSRRWQRVKKILQPGRGARRVIYLLLGVDLVTTICLVVLMLLPGVEAPACTSDLGACFQMLAFGTTIFVLPLTLVFLVVAVLVEKRAGPRAVFWLSAAAVIAVLGLLLGVSMMLDETIHFDAFLAFLLTGVAPLFLLFSAPGIYLGAKTAPELKAALKDDLIERLLYVVQARGELSLDELADELDLAVQECDRLVEQLLSNGRLSGTYDPARRILYTPAALAERQRSIREAVHAAGQISLEALAMQLNVPEPVVVDWIYQLVQRDQFHGYINWTDRVLYAVQADQLLGANSQCPACGGKLALTGPKTVRCQHCGSEML